MKKNERSFGDLWDSVQAHQYNHNDNPRGEERKVQKEYLKIKWPKTSLI